ncbi:hypothetical protein D3C78_1670400 [compost metagenome]
MQHTVLAHFGVVRVQFAKFGQVKPHMVRVALAGEQLLLQQVGLARPLRTGNDEHFRGWVTFRPISFARFVEQRIVELGEGILHVAFGERVKRSHSAILRCLPQMGWPTL